MSSRALRKALREREEEEKAEEIESSDESLPIKKSSAFALLAQDDSDDEEHSDTEPQPESVDPQSGTQTKKKKKKKRKKKGKGKGPDAGLDEIDLALRHLRKNGKSQPEALTTNSPWQTLLAIDINNLSPEAEMRRLFGRITTATDPSEADRGNTRVQKQMQQLLNPKNRQATMASRKSLYIQGKETWPMAPAGGLSMDIVDTFDDGSVMYTYMHNTSYNSVQREFDFSVDAMDHEMLLELMQKHPYHVATLLQVSEMMTQERDVSTARDLLERALFTMGRTVHSSFARNLAQGKARLDFAKRENREFWLCAWRYMQSLSMGATWRTVYEWAKLLLALDPKGDPYRIWLVLDQYALRSRMHLDYLNVSRDLELKPDQGAPHMAFSQALAEVRGGDKDKGKQDLFTAIAKYPWMVARMMQELGVDAPPAVWGKQPRTGTEMLHATLYAVRAKDIWNTPEATNLLVEVASAVQPTDKETDTFDEPVRENDARHVLLTNDPQFIALLPRAYTARVGTSSDPLPPTATTWSLVQAMEAMMADSPADPNEPTTRFMQSLRESLREVIARVEQSQTASPFVHAWRNGILQWSGDDSPEAEATRRAEENHQAHVEDASDHDDDE
ncbi:DUF654-domain-containing protein [Piedraia hortae CBS 480.64]|uniref:DUF654-domain-containing protein n=1 Tax=Piedraia hortae CBS 480.64 TaxID=1314780 RepID=A0A6A7CAJ0_9PEZI|nr:DUF654-domain-containing protein [Piedraia hortae CBS 480.64]